MDIQAMVQAIKVQFGLGVLPGADDNLRMSLLGQAYVADWKYLLHAAGRMYKLSLGTITAGGDIVLVGNGTIVNLDQPQGVLALDKGLRLIPVELEVSAEQDMDTYEDELDILLTGDRTQAVAAGATATIPAADLSSIASIQNLLDGGPDFPGRAYGVVTGDIVDPVHSEIFAYKRWELIQAVAETGGGVPGMPFYYYKEFHHPASLDGPCSLLLYVAGTAAVTFIGSLTVGVVPSNWFPTD